MPERESIEIQRELANGVFIWLQQTHDTLPPPLNLRAAQFANDLSIAREDFVQVRSLVNEMDGTQTLPVRLHVAGFDEWVISELDDGSFSDTWDVFTLRLKELFPVDEVQLEPVAESVSEVKNTPVGEAVADETERPKPKPQTSKQLGIQATMHASRQSTSTMKELSLLIDEDREEFNWQEKGLCAQTDPEAFFPEKGGSTREAKKVCMQCEVREECLEAALERDERFGIWGGLSERERRKLKKRAV